MLSLLRRTPAPEREPAILGVWRYPVTDDDGEPVEPPRERYGWTCRACLGDGGWVDIVDSYETAWMECCDAGSEHLLARHPEWVKAARLRMLVVTQARSSSSLPVLASDLPMPSEVARRQRTARRETRRRALRRFRPWWMPTKVRWDDA